MARPKQTVKKTDRCRVVRAYLRNGDLIKIAKMSGYSVPYTRQVLQGQRYNADILLCAIQVAKQNRKLGLVKTIKQ